MVGPTCVQAGVTMHGLLFFTSKSVRLFLCNKSEWSVPLAS